MILYKGPSRIDGSPIVVIATIGSKNPKTGPMVQTWILREDISPVEAVKSGQDESICGDCPQRHYLGGACYVTPFQAPLRVYKAYKNGNYDDSKNIKRVSIALKLFPIRMGAYGDPCAVPIEVWKKLLENGCGKFTGYSHQWNKKGNQEYRKFLMASTDNEEQTITARIKGWRTFQVVIGGDAVPSETVECLSDAKDLSCAECGICDGTRGVDNTRRASVYIQAHGARANRYQLQVLR